MRSIQAVIILVFLGAIVVFALQNTDLDTVNFVSWNLSEPIAL